MNVIAIKYSMEAFWGELVFVEARLKAEPTARHLVAPVEAHLAKYEKLLGTERELRRAGILMRAQSKTTDGRVVAHVAEVNSATLYEVKQDRKDPRYSMLYRMPVSDFGMLSFGAQQEEVMRMMTVLRLPQYDDLFRDAQQEVLEHALLEIDGITEAQKQLADREMFHREDVKMWKEKANDVRLEVYGELVKTPGMRSKVWARSFFLPPKNAKKLSTEEKARLDAERAERKKKKSAEDLVKFSAESQKAQDKLDREKAKSVIDGKGNPGSAGDSGPAPDPAPSASEASKSNGAAPPQPDPS